MGEPTMARFKVGDTVWVSRAGPTERTRPCPVCAGEKRVTLILGSGEHVALDCQYCTRGFLGPTGREAYYEYGPTAIPYPVTGVEVVVTTDGGEEVRYRSGGAGGWTSFDANECFATQQEALRHAESKVAEAEAEQERRLAAKEKADKSYSWHVGYHRKEAARARREAEHHERKVVLMQTKVRAATAEEASNG